MHKNAKNMRPYWVSNSRLASRCHGKSSSIIGLFLDFDEEEKMNESEDFPCFAINLMASYNEEIEDEELVSICETVENSTTHDNKVLNDNEIEMFVEENRNNNTKKKTVSDMKNWYKWCISTGEKRKMEEIPEQELDKLLCHFFIKAKKANGEDYEPDTLTSFQRSFDRHLREAGKTFCIFKDRAFIKSQEVLESKRKQLRRDGRGRKPNKALGLSDQELTKLWEEKQVGPHSPLSLIRTVWLNNTMHFGWRARDEHRKCCLGDFQLKHDENNQEYIEWITERGTKTRTGGKYSVPERQFNPRMYATTDERCPVKIFKDYLEKRPQEMKKPSDPFYLAVIQNPRTKIWYKAQPLGEHSLSKFMKSMTEAVDIKGKHTNHSARRTMITTLRHDNVNHLDIAQLSGHRNIKSLDSYSEASVAQQKRMSLCLSNHVAGSSNSSSAEVPHIRPQIPPEVSKSTEVNGGLFSGAVFSNCSFYLGDQPQVPSLKRVKRILDSDSSESEE